MGFEFSPSVEMPDGSFLPTLGLAKMEWIGSRLFLTYIEHGQNRVRGLNMQEGQTVIAWFKRQPHGVQARIDYKE